MPKGPLAPIRHHFIVFRGRDNDPITYPSFTCIEDSHHPNAASPVPFGSPMAATTNVCCLHGVQSKPALRISPRPAAITSGFEADSALNNSSTDSSTGWFSPLKKVAEWFQFMKRDEKSISQQVPEPQQPSLSWPSASTPASSSAGFLPNGYPTSGPASAAEDEQSWMSRALRRYVNIENMPKIPAFLQPMRQPSQESEAESTNEAARPARILKVVTQSEAPPPIRLEQRSSGTVRTVIVPQAPAPAKTPVPSVSVNLPLSTTPKIPPPVLPKSKQPVIFDGKSTFTSTPFNTQLKQPGKPSTFMASRRLEQAPEKPSPIILRSIATPAPAKPAALASTAPPSQPKQPTLIHIHVKPSVASVLAKRDEQEEETDSTDSDEVMEQKMKEAVKLAAIISVPTVVQHHGATTVHMQLKKHEMSMVPLASDDEEMPSPRPREEKMPTIVIEEAKTPERVLEPPRIELTAPPPEQTPPDSLSPYEEPVSSVSQSEDTSAPHEELQPEHIPDEIWLVPFPQETAPGQEKTTWFMASGEGVPPPTMEEAQILPASLYEALSAEPGFVEAATPSQPEVEKPIQLPEEPEKLSLPSEVGPVSEPVYTTFEFPTSSEPEPSEEQKLTVTNIRLQWPPPSNATGVEIVKDVIGRPDINEDETPSTEDSKEASKKTDFPKRE